MQIEISYKDTTGEAPADLKDLPAVVVGRGVGHTFRVIGGRLAMLARSAELPAGKYRLTLELLELDPAPVAVVAAEDPA